MIWRYQHKTPSEVARLKEQKRKNEEYWNKRYCEQAERIESLRNQLEIKRIECNMLNKMLVDDNKLKEQLGDTIKEIETFLHKNKYPPEGDLTDWQEITNIHYQNLLFKQEIHKIGKALFKLLYERKREN